MQVVWSAEKHVTRAGGKRGNHVSGAKRAKTSITGRLNVGRLNERVRAKRCDAVDWGSLI